MSKAVVIISLVSVVLLIAALLPIRRGVELNCDDGVYVKMREVGLPFSYYQTTGQGDMICVPKGQSLNAGVGETKSRFDPAQLWFDLILYGGIFMGTLFLMDKRKAAV